jgi:uncharacterized protein YdaL
MKTSTHIKNDSTLWGGSRRLIGIMVVSAFLVAPVRGYSQTAPLPPPPNILILYDDTGNWGWLGGVYALKLENLLAHFESKTTKKPLGQYLIGDLVKYDATFYLGSTYTEEALSPVFQADLNSNTKPFVWAGFNLWRYAWNDPLFVGKYGFQFLNYAPENHPKVVYKNTDLKKEVWDPGLNHVQILDPNLAKVHATAMDGSGGEWPYIVQSGNFWFVADMPLISTSFENRSLAFADLLHDMLGINHPESHRAYFRVEDVSRESDSASLKAITKAVTSLKVPFLISLIPSYRDWMGVYNNGIPVKLNITANSTVGKEVKLWLSAGGQILQHGTTHQIDGLLNPYSGVSGEDYEFYRITLDSTNKISYVGPVPGDSVAWVQKRIVQGQNILKNAGFTPIGWLTPHYIASPVDYKVFASLYPFACDRAIFFVTNSSGGIQPDEFNSPFVYRDTYGIKRIPETIGYPDPNGDDGAPVFPVDLVRRAQALKVVRDGWAGFYFHWYLNPSHLIEIVNGLKEIGYEFVVVDQNTK